MPSPRIWYVNVFVFDLARAVAAKGVRFTMPPSVQPWGGILATFADPDGNVSYLDQLREE